jgi:predicted regulator of Ras-like GTPase activity (Roadblock/LC7/MglB family)
VTDLRVSIQEIVKRNKDIDLILLMGNDGIIVEKINKLGDLSLEQMCSEFAISLQNSLSRKRDMLLGNIREIRMKSKAMNFVAVDVSEDYFLFAATKNKAMIGKTRFDLVIGAETLAEEFK